MNRGLVTAVLLTLNLLDSSGRAASAGPVGACCLPGFTCSGGFTVIECLNVGGNYQGDGSTCGETLCGACCIGGGACIEARSADSCVAILGGAFQGPATECEGVNCIGQAPDGACCLVDSCTLVNAVECLGLGGTFVGEGTLCAACGCRSDINGDGFVDTVDFLTLIGDWGPCF